MAKRGKSFRLSKVAREFNVGLSTIVEFLGKNGVEIDSNPNAKVSPEAYDLLVGEYSSDLSMKKESEELSLKHSRAKQQTVSLDDVDEESSTKEKEEEIIIKDVSAPVAEEVVEKTESKAPKVVGKIDLETISGKKKKQEEDAVEEEPVKEEVKEEVVEPAAEAAPVEEEKVEETPVSSDDTAEEKSEEEDKENVKVIGKIDLSSINQKTRPARKSKKEKEEERKAKTKTTEEEDSTEQPAEKPEVETVKELEAEVKEEVQEETKEDFIQTEFQKLSGPTVVGKIELPKKVEKKKETSDSDSDDDKNKKKKKRKRIRKDKERVSLDGKEGGNNVGGGDRKTSGKKSRKKKTQKKEISEEEIQQQIKDTLARLTSKGKSKGAKYRREKRDAISQKAEEELKKAEEEKSTLKVTEFVTVAELATFMSTEVNEIISTCMSLGLFVSINQRLDAETITMVAEEFGYEVEFVSVELHDLIKEEEDQEEDLLPRSPIVTVMGHVDHGKTKLLDYVRSANVVAGEAGGITQHIGAYSVEVDDGKHITFLDTPGHEAFTAMRARGAQVTDISIIMVAADDGIKPQTVEAINHAQAAGVPMVFAINKIDKPTAKPDKVKEELANMNILVEDWGGKYQSQEISAKQGIAIDELLEKVLLEAELLELKANPNRKASGTVIESTLDKGRGYITTILVQKGTLRVGDVILAGSHTGHVKAMYNERNQRVKEAGPSTPVLILGLNGAPQAGDLFYQMDTDKEARDIAAKREQLIREQSARTKKHITLDEIGRRIAIGNFQELNVIVKGDVDGSIEALSDSLIKLSTDEIHVNIIHKAVGQISETDVMLAAASNAIIVGFQVRPSTGARKMAEKEEIDIRLYSIIYDAINEIKDAMEGMLSPDIREDIIATLEIKETFKITKVGTIAGCMVTDGKINRESKVRVIRDGIVIYTGLLGSLKRFKDDVKEVHSGLECGLNIQNFNDIKVGDVVEGFVEHEVKKKL
jgi:translation initiation factor IF-2